MCWAVCQPGRERQRACAWQCGWCPGAAWSALPWSPAPATASVVSLAVRCRFGKPALRARSARCAAAWRSACQQRRFQPCTASSMLPPGCLRWHPSSVNVNHSGSEPFKKHLALVHTPFHHAPLAARTGLAGRRAGCGVAHDPHQGRKVVALGPLALVSCSTNSHSALFTDSGHVFLTPALATGLLL